MKIVMLPGFCRSASMLAHWRQLLPAEVTALDLPGHANAPAAQPPTVEAIADGYSRLIPEDAIVIGESLGGVIALKLAQRGYRAVAIDPPLSTLKLWPLQNAVTGVLRRYPDLQWLPPFVDELLGIRLGQRSVERNYWPLLTEVAGVVDVVAAGLPLWPPHAEPLTPDNTPSVLDEMDAYHLRRHPNVRFRTVEGPHTLLTERVEAMHRVLLEIIGAS